MFILTLSVLYFLPFGKNIMKLDFLLYLEKVCWYGTKLLFFAILHLSLQLVCQNLCEHGIDWCHQKIVLGLRQLIHLLYHLYIIKKVMGLIIKKMPHIIFI